MSKWILIVAAAVVVGGVCWVFGSHLWDVVAAMHGH